ncbi:hypothetical protein SAMN05444483_105137 [Salegentibacter echinorum]|uniref:Uncharacterized protein n=1 Tax=Salegentibacter echinorum TaxID=1073325 RepID=A0A1M5HG79_SALEC|nr:hypothetical protein SAMN05444483_105137 [Salegentibacter echinorum]
MINKPSAITIAARNISKVFILDLLNFIKPNLSIEKFVIIQMRGYKNSEDWKPVH